MKYKIELIIDSSDELSNEDIKTKFSKVQFSKISQIGKNIYISPNISDYIAVAIPINSSNIEWKILESDYYPHVTRIYLSYLDIGGYTECAADKEDFESYGIDIHDLEIYSTVNEFDSIRLKDKFFILLKIKND